MEILNVNESQNDRYYSKTFTLNNGIKIESLIDIIKQFENDQVRMLACYCNTFDENGNQLHYKCNSIEEIKKIGQGPSPYIDFSIDFGNPESMSYNFSLLTSINSNVLQYVIDKKKINDESLKNSLKHH